MRRAAFWPPTTAASQWALPVTSPAWKTFGRGVGRPGGRDADRDEDRVGVQRTRSLPQSQLDPVVLVQLAEVVAAARAHERVERVGVEVDERGPDPAGGRRGRDLLADQAGADDREVAGGGERVVERDRVRAGAEGERVREGGERSGRGARGDQRLVVLELVEAGDALVAEVDVVVAVPGVGLQPDLRPLASEEGLGERRAVVRQLVAVHGDRAVVAELAERLGAPLRREARADEDDSHAVTPLGLRAGFRLRQAGDEEGDGRDGGGEHERAQPGGLGVRARAERVDQAEDVDERRRAVQLAPALAADPAAGVEAQAERRGEVAADDAEADEDRLEVDDERDRDAGETRLEEAVAEQREAVDGDRDERRRARSARGSRRARGGVAAGRRGRRRASGRSARRRRR